MKKYSFLIVLIIFMSCSNAKETVSFLINYKSNVYIASLMQEGATDIPNINWNNNIGTFKLKEEKNGFSIHKTTGQISWNKSIKAGTNLITVIAENSTGAKEIPIEIFNDISKTFWTGGPKTPDGVKPDKSIRLLKDGTVSVTFLENPDPNSKGTGVWSFTNDILSIEFCTYCADKNPKEVVNMTEHTLIEATIHNKNALEIYFKGELFSVDANKQNKQKRNNVVYYWD